MFYLAFSDTTPAGKGMVPVCYCQTEVKSQVSHTALVDSQSDAGDEGAMVTTGQWQELWLRRWSPLTPWWHGLITAG